MWLRWTLNSVHLPAISMSGFACLADETLQAYQNGTADPALIDSVAQHLSSCPDCFCRLQNVASADDSLLRALRRQQSLPACPLDPLIAAAIAQTLSPAGGFAAGTVLNEYRLLEKLGSGGMGTVYRALHLRLDKEVALKVIRPIGGRDRQMRERFEREMKAIGRLRHPQIVLATDAGETQGVLYLVMELEQGADLAHYVRERGPLPVAEACDCARQAALGLAAAHDAGLVHRDIKPSNLFRTAGGQIKLLDLGLALLEVDETLLAKPANSADDDTIVDSSRSTTARTRGAMGTDDYMAPEQWSDAHLVDARADLYSLGCTLYFLLTGRPPFDLPRSAARGQLREAHLQAAPPTLRSLRPDAPPRLAALVQRLIAKKPDGRPQSAAEVARELAAFSQPRSRRVVWTTATVLLVAGLLGAAAIANWNPAESPSAGNPAETPSAPIADLASGDSAAVSPPPPAPRPPKGILPMTPEVARQLQAQWAEYLHLPTVFTSSAGIEWALVPPGEFVERLGLIVEIDKPYYLATAETTMRQFRQFVEERGHVTDVERNGLGGTIINFNNSHKNLRQPQNTWQTPGFPVESDDCPVVHVTWDDAMAYCAWLGAKEGATCRLQTAAEWTWAARAGNADPYYAARKAEQLTPYEWFSSNAENRPHAVRTRSANAWGLFDLNGNVSEWCLDLPEPDRRGHVFDAPLPAAGPQRTLAGGAYISTLATFRTSDGQVDPQHATTRGGFRVVYEIALAPPPP